MSYDYSENILVQESAGHLLEDELGWRVELAYNTEVLGETGTFGRKSYKEILLVKYLKEALLKLNPWLTPALLEDAIKTFESHMSSASLMQINEEKYRHIRDGIPVKVKKPNGQIEEKKAIVIDFTNTENNDFLAINENTWRSLSETHRYCGVCKWNTSSFYRIEEEFCRCAECIHR